MRTIRSRSSPSKSGLLSDGFRLVRALLALLVAGLGIANGGATADGVLNVMGGDDPIAPRNRVMLSLPVGAGAAFGALVDIVGDVCVLCVYTRARKGSERRVTTMGQSNANKKTYAVGIQFCCKCTHFVLLSNPRGCYRAAVP
jgi:hypothetical protein